jgi:hypothetical protein
MTRSFLASLILAAGCNTLDGTAPTTPTTGTESSSGGYSWGSTGGSSGSSSEDTGADTDDTGGDTDSGTDTGSSSEDTGCAEYIWYADNDGDGYGNVVYALESCTQPTGYVPNADDLDDGSAIVKNEAVPAMLCILVDETIAGDYAMWWADMTASDYGSSHWGFTATNADPEDSMTDCVEIADFRPNHQYAINGAYWDGSGWLYLADHPDVSRVQQAIVLFEDDDGGFDDMNGTFDYYHSVDRTGDTLGDVGSIAFMAHTDGSAGGDLVLTPYSDYEGAY